MSLCFNITITFTDHDSARGGAPVEQSTNTGYYHADDIYGVLTKILEEMFIPEELEDYGIELPVTWHNHINVVKQAYACELDVEEGTLYFKWDEDDMNETDVQLLKPFKWSE